MAFTEDETKAINNHPFNNATFSAKLRDLNQYNETWRGNIVSLLGALLISPPASIIRSADGDRVSIVEDALFKLMKTVRLGSFERPLFRPLIDAVVAHSSDIDIWIAGINLLKAASLIQGTPVSGGSRRLPAQNELFYELRNCTHRSVPGFFEKHLDSAKWDDTKKGMLKSILDIHDGKRWKGFPDEPWEKDVWAWLVKLEGKSLAGGTYRLHTNKADSEFNKDKGHMNIFFRDPINNQLEYKDVLVVGEYKRFSDDCDFEKCLLRLARHVRNIFYDQPIRHFVHAFTVRGTRMELWVFDRSGAYSSGHFDIHEEPDKFARALVAYATMDEEAMGLDQFMEKEDHRRYITVEDANGQDKRIELVHALFRRNVVVSRATTCFAVENGGVAKFSWRSAKNQPCEVRYLKMARNRGVEGVVTLIGHSNIVTIGSMREGLEFSRTTQHKFRSTARNMSLEYESSNGTTRTRTTTSRPPNRKKFRHEDRVLSCLVISPAGRGLKEFRTVRELLETLRDAIRGHQSLYIKGNILHGDISANNIIITNPKESGGYKGMLIDLDLSRERDISPSDVGYRTGTLPFMAIDVLLGIDHTYRHDLESFFYVLLWMCARRAWSKKDLLEEGEEPVTESELCGWENGSWQDISRNKQLNMSLSGFDYIVEEFPQAFAGVIPFCEKLRTIFFGDRSLSEPGTSLPGDPSDLYDHIIRVFDEAIKKY